MDTHQTLDVNEIFESVCGEINGFNGCGQISTFIRLNGCNLACRWCDTLYAKGAPKCIMHIDDIIAKVKTRHVTITGGEPFEQSNITKLANQLITREYDVSIETNGTHPCPNELLRGACLIMDYKLPSSQMMGRMNLSAFKTLQENDWIKCVCQDAADFTHALAFLRENEIGTKNIAFSPVTKPNDHDEFVWAQELCHLMLEAQKKSPHFDFHFSLQIHKLIGVA